MVELNDFFSISDVDIKLIFKWDVTNWSRVLSFWLKSSRFQSPNKLKVLEVGAFDGGLSLAFALSGAQVDCTDVFRPNETARDLHARFGVSNSIHYFSQNALENYQAKYDIIVFKSVLGAIATKGQLQLAHQAVDGMKKALKEGGEIWFAENMRGSILHALSRGLFRKWGRSWNYFTCTEIRDVFGDGLELTTAGFFGAFGRTEKQKCILGKIDQRVEKFIPTGQRYIAFGLFKSSSASLPARRAIPSNPVIINS